MDQEHGREDAPGIGEQRVGFTTHFADASPAQNETQRRRRSRTPRPKVSSRAPPARAARTARPARARASPPGSETSRRSIAHEELAAGQTRRRRCDELRNQSRRSPFGEILGHSPAASRPAASPAATSRETPRLFSSAGAHAHSICHARTLRLCVGDPRRYVSRANSLSAPGTASSAAARDRESATSGRGGVRRRLVRAEAFRRRARRERVRHGTSAAARAATSSRVSRLAYPRVRKKRGARRGRRARCLASALPAPARPSSKISRASPLQRLRSLYQTLRQRARATARALERRPTCARWPPRRARNGRKHPRSREACISSRSAEAASKNAGCSAARPAALPGAFLRNFVDVKSTS